MYNRRKCLKHQVLQAAPGQYAIVHCGMTHDSPKVETTQISING